MIGKKSDSAAKKPPKNPDFGRVVSYHMNQCTGCPKGHHHSIWIDTDLADKVNIKNSTELNNETKVTPRTICNYRSGGVYKPDKKIFKALIEKGFEIEQFTMIDGVETISPDYQELFEAAFPGEPLPKPPAHSRKLQHQPINEAPLAVPDSRPESPNFARTQHPTPRTADPFKTFPKLTVSLEQRARQVEKAIHQLLTHSGKETPLRQALDLLLSRWGDHDVDQEDDREFTLFTEPVDAYQLITDLAGAIESCNTDHWQQRGAPAELAALRRWVERIAKFVFALGWTEEAWAKLVMPDFEKQIHDICDGDLLYAGHNAARGRDFEMPHSKLIDNWRVKIDPAIDPGILRDLEMSIYDQAANHIGVSARPLFEEDGSAEDYEVCLAQWQRRVAVRIKVLSDKKRRSVSLTARLAGAATEPSIPELQKYAQAIHSHLHVWSGRPGSFFCCDDDLFLDALYVLQQEIHLIP